MEIIKTLIWIIQLVSAVSIIVLVLLQHGKGADAGATFGSGGGSGSLFGATGSANFLSHATAIFATVFFLCTFGLVVVSNHNKGGNAGIMSGLNGKVISSATATNVVAHDASASAAASSNVKSSSSAVVAPPAVNNAAPKSTQNQMPQ
jgi:preprotein translocase subunit SecG